MRVCCITEAPRVTVAPRDQRVADNDIVSFFCEASGYPEPEFSWRTSRGGPVTPDHGRYSMFDMPHGSALRIEPVRAASDDDVVVECVADNGVGDAVTAAAQLDVYQEDRGSFRLRHSLCCSSSCERNVCLRGLHACFLPGSRKGD